MVIETIPRCVIAKLVVAVFRSGFNCCHIMDTGEGPTLGAIIHATDSAGSDARLRCSYDANPRRLTVDRLD